MEKQNGKDLKDIKSENDAHNPKAQEHHAPPASDDAHRTPKKRRKVNHACVYCRRSHMTCDLQRPCLRCIKRNIGHLCHDEPRDSDSKKSKSVIGAPTVDESESQVEIRRNSRDQVAGAGTGSGSMGPPAPASSFDGSSLNAATGSGQPTKLSFDAGALGRGNPLLVQQPTPISGIQAQAQAVQANPLTNNNMSQLAGFPESWMTAPHPFQDMHNFHPNYLIGPPQVSDEFNLLNDFLHSSMLEDGGLLTEDQLVGNQPDTVQKFLSTYNNTLDQAGNGHLLPPSAMQSGSMLPPPLTNPNTNKDNTTSSTSMTVSNADQARDVARPSNVIPVDKARAYWLQAADPAGNDTPSQRMQKLLQAKYDAGLLRPFNYVKGYARLSKYLEGHVAPASRQKISRQLDRFRPLFREKMHALTDIDLIVVEMWFEETLMGYDRVFASMAVPACCWRRTGEIFRGNKEMAELINVPVESLRDGKIALHEILTEDSVVRYWEEFGTIAFDPAHDTLLTACSLKSPDEKSKRPPVNCCFSFMIRRDEHKIPSLIVGNFLPHDPE